jgi:hypothetical protein
MRLVELVFERADGTKFSVPFDEAHALQNLLGQLPHISQPKEEKVVKSDPLEKLAEFARKAAEEREKERQRTSPMPPNWPWPEPRPWGYDPLRPTYTGDDPYPQLFKITCEQQPLRFEWGAIKDGMVKGRASQEIKFHVPRPA